MVKVKDNLAEILEAHRLWLESDGKKGTLANLSEADLSGANLSGADLSGAYLRRANLSGANLKGTKLQRVYLSWSSLHKADLTEAILHLSRIDGAGLSQAKLNRADLRGVSLIEADLSGADISGACLDNANTCRWNIEGIICTHLETGPGRRRIDYAPGEFEQKYTYLEGLSEIILNVPLSELTLWVGLITESAINQHQPNIPIKFQGQEALSDEITKLSFIVFAPDDDGVHKTQDRLTAIEQNLRAVAGDMREVRPFVEDERQPKGVLVWADEIPLGPSWSPLRVRPAEIVRTLIERYNQLPQIIKKVLECIQSSFAM